MTIKPGQLYHYGPFVGEEDFDIILTVDEKVKYFSIELEQKHNYVKIQNLSMKSFLKDLELSEYDLQELKK